MRDAARVALSFRPERKGGQGSQRWRKSYGWYCPSAAGTGNKFHVLVIRLGRQLRNFGYLSDEGPQRRPSEECQGPIVKKARTFSQRRPRMRNSDLAAKNLRVAPTKQRRERTMRCFEIGIGNHSCTQGK